MNALPARADDEDGHGDGDEDGDDFAQIKALFNEVCDLPDAAAARAHLQALQTRPALIASVLALLHEDAANSTRISKPVAGMLASAAGPELQAGDQLGVWRLLSELGHGGMGLVFLAERSDGHYEQRVALKLLRGFSGADALERLARERQILASLSHPHIARLIDGGTTPAGRPYLVMDHVAGLALDQHCATQQLPLAAVLDLFDQVCDAVAYAHRQLVVHCDIKPANVLVTAEGRAMLLDFGIAQLQGQDDEGQLALTPRYASPEQRTGEPGRPASDIYSLGRVLDELLHAVQPATPRPGEWQAIVNKACAQDPAQRYDSVQALQADLRRFREQRPVQAVAGGWPYAWRKGLRRHWPWALAGVGVLALSTAFTLRLVHERDRAVQAEAQSRQEAATTHQVSDFVIGLFEGADPSRSGRPDVSAVALVDQGRERLDRELKGQPDLLGTMQAVLARVYQHLGKEKTAAELYAQAAEQEHLLQHPLREAQALRRLSGVLSDSHENAKAVTAAQRALDLRLRAGQGPETLDIADAREGLGNALRGAGDLKAAAPELQAALRIRQAQQGPAHADLAQSLHLSGLLARDQGDRATAADLLRQAYAMKLQVAGPRDPSTLTSQQQLATTLAQLARYGEAEVLLRDLVARRTEVEGPDSIGTSRAWNELAGTLQDAGRLEEAVAAYGQALTGSARSSGTRTVSYAVTLNNLGSLLDEMGQSAAAGLVYRESLAIRQALLPAGDLSIANAQHNLARWLYRNGSVAEARALAEAALAVRGARLPAGHDAIVNSQIGLAEMCSALNDRAAAQRYLAAAEPYEAKMLPLRRATLWRMQAILLAGAGRYDQAIAKRQAGLDLSLKNNSAANPNFLRLRLELAQLQLKTGHGAAAREQMQAMLPLMAAQRPESRIRQEAERFQQQLMRRTAVVANPGTNPHS